MRLLAHLNSENHSVVSDSLWPLWPFRLPCSWNSPSKHTGMGFHSLLQGIFSTLGSNPGLMHCRQILYHLSHQGSPEALSPPCPHLPFSSPPPPIHYSSSTLALLWGPWSILSWRGSDIGPWVPWKPLTHSFHPSRSFRGEAWIGLQPGTEETHRKQCRQQPPVTWE